MIFFHGVEVRRKYFQKPNKLMKFERHLKKYHRIIKWWSSWWFQPLWKNSKIGSFPQIGMKKTNIWNHHPVQTIASQRRIPTPFLVVAHPRRDTDDNLPSSSSTVSESLFVVTFSGVMIWPTQTMNHFEDTSLKIFHTFASSLIPLQKWVRFNDPWPGPSSYNKIT